ncbi:uncharacterized protein LY79DRAFT_519668 [Colletotrichum navitas]|uniref:Uncharacterized protein n=1 Tax=Colletotrichum navitas TaxID=681940 RepID=A0AAD8PUW9_9PEZI|nr:uncharacterized protein LY79DRAFT_519668 [Colletotrichum navitas]KAK1584937.1 hypothetical protein LY79DRAFT_519668 [Colletotrichum navitas]
MSTVPIPTAPRAMLSEALNNSEASTSPSEEVFIAATRKLYPRLALFGALAGFKNHQERRKPSNDEIVEARRNFLDSFSYLCDVQKGGATVTAAGLQKLSHGNILWLAANEGIRNDIRTYAETILSCLKSVNSETEKTVQEKIFHLAVKNCNSRISTYNEEVRRYARNCRMQLRDGTKNDVVTLLRRRLKKLSEPPPSMAIADIVDYCYDMRVDDVNKIKRMSKHSTDDFCKLAHYVGRLGATRSAARYVVKGMMTVPALGHISGIRTVEAPSIRKVIMDQRDLSPYEIVREICKEPASQNPLQNRMALRTLVEFDLPSETNNVRVRLNSQSTIITRVHAELQIADKFSRDHYAFVDGDKYVGCSKPACYFCFHWLSNHKHGYALPAAHYKIIPGCRGPDSNINESGAAVLKEMYAKLCAGLGQHILDFLLKTGSGDKRQYYENQAQSTEGSSYAQSRIIL